MSGGVDKQSRNSFVRPIVGAIERSGDQAAREDEASLPDDASGARTVPRDCLIRVSLVVENEYRLDSSVCQTNEDWQASHVDWICWMPGRQFLEGIWNVPVICLPAGHWVEEAPGYVNRDHRWRICPEDCIGVPRSCEIDIGGE